MTKLQDSRATGVSRREAMQILGGAAIGMGALLNAGMAAAQQPVAPVRPGPASDSIPKFPPDNPTWKTEFKQLAPNVYVYLQAGGPDINNTGISNAGCIVGPDSMMAIDSLAAPFHTKAFMATATKATGKSFGRLVNTHHHNDHTDGNQFFAAGEIVGSDFCRQTVAKASTAKPTYWDKREGWADGTEAWKLTPPNRSISEKVTYLYGDLVVECLVAGIAHTWGDVIVHLPQHKIVFIGDIGFFGVRPTAWQGHVSKWIDKANMILAMDVDVIVPGHGHVGGKKDLAMVRDYFVNLKREARKRFDAGISVEKAAADIHIGDVEWKTIEPDSTNVGRLYKEFDGTIVPLPV